MHSKRTQNHPREVVRSRLDCAVDALSVRLLSDAMPAPGNVSRHDAIIVDAVQRRSGLCPGVPLVSCQLAALGRPQMTRADPLTLRGHASSKIG